MKDEALKLALEALQNSVDLVREDAYNAEKLYGNYPTRQGKVRGLKVLADDHENAITAIKQALALDKMADNARELGLDYEPVLDVSLIDEGKTAAPVQEPDHGDELTIAYMSGLHDGKKLAAQPAVPDAIHHTDLSEHPQYIEGWNDCRAEMLKGMK